jgi:putative membrane protein
MTIEGVRDFGPLRDFLYSRMRGAKGLVQPQASAGATRKASDSAAPVTCDLGDVAAALREAVSELQEIRAALERRAGSSVNG